MRGCRTLIIDVLHKHAHTRNQYTEIVAMLPNMSGLCIDTLCRTTPKFTTIPTDPRPHIPMSISGGPGKRKRGTDILISIMLPSEDPIIQLNEAGVAVVKLDTNVDDGKLIQDNREVCHGVAASWPSQNADIPNTTTPTEGRRGLNNGTEPNQNADRAKTTTHTGNTGWPERPQDRHGTRSTKNTESS